MNQQEVLEIKPYEWIKFDDLEESTHTIAAWGLDRNSKPNFVRFINFKLSFVVQLPSFINRTPARWNLDKAGKVYNLIKKLVGENEVDTCLCKIAPMLYFYTDEKYPIIQIWFNTENAAMKARNILKYPLKLYQDGDTEEIMCTVWESDISSILQFLTLIRSRHSQWFRTKGYKVKRNKLSTLENEYIVDCSNIRSFPKGYVPKDLQGNPNIPMLENIPAFPVIPISNSESKGWITHPGCLVIDIEQYSDNPKAMPVKTIREHVVYMISCIYQKMGVRDSRQRYVIIMGDSSKLESPEDEDSDKIIVIKVRDEFELCEALCDIIQKTDPEVISGYNILDYDYPVLNQRLENMAKEWNIKASRLLSVAPKLIMPKTWTSKAYGHNEYYFINFPGRISIDLLPIIRKGHKLPKYDLNTVGMKFLKKGKHDIKAKEMFKIYEDLNKYKKLYEKCVKAWVKPESVTKASEVLNIKELYSLSPELISESSEGLVPIYHKNVNKDVIKEILINYENAKSKMAKVALYCVRDSELVIEIIDNINIWIGLVELSNVFGVSITDVFSRGQQIRGVSQLYYILKPAGVVMNYHPPNTSSKFTGGYVGDPIPGIYDFVMVLDFASLYPSIIQAYNICYNTLIKPTNTSVTPDDCHHITCPVLDEDGNETGTITHRFIKKEVRKGYVPILVEELVKQRRAVQAEMKAQDIVEGSIQWVTLNERQLALKTASNSIYGMLGVGEKGILPLMEGAECVTSIGREKIQFCNKYLIDTYKAKIIYNDTDSTFFILPEVNNYVTGIKRMNELAKELSELMMKPMYLEAEKIGRMLAIKKKKYAFWLADSEKLMWKDKKKKDIKIDNPHYGKLKDYKEDPYVIIPKGIILARRDNFQFLRNTYWKILTMVLEGESFDSVFNTIIQSCIKLYKGKVPWQDLIIIRSLGAHYKSDNYFMKIFGEEIKKLGRPANPGDRLEYLIVKGESDLLGQRLRLPEVYVERQGSSEEEKIDTLYYLEKLFIKSIEQLWQVGYNTQLEKLMREHYIKDSYAIIEETKIFAKTRAYLVDQIVQYFQYDYLKVIEYFETTLKENYETSSDTKYIYNRYIDGRRHISTGRDAFNPRITDTPIKDLIKSIKKGKYDEHISAILTSQN